MPSNPSSNYRPFIYVSYRPTDSLGVNVFPDRDPFVIIFYPPPFTITVARTENLLWSSLIFIFYDYFQKCSLRTSVFISIFSHIIVDTRNCSIVIFTLTIGRHYCAGYVRKVKLFYLCNNNANTIRVIF